MSEKDVAKLIYKDCQPFLSMTQFCSSKGENLVYRAIETLLETLLVKRKIINNLLN
jgi:hypothetical protein